MAVIGLYFVLGVAGALYLAPTTVLGLDLETYRRAGEALWAGGDPYAASLGLGPEMQYRYPPLLAMLMPIVGQPVVWYPLLAAATTATIWVGYRAAGWPGVLPAVLLIGAWGQQLLNGNAQGVVVLLLALTPLLGRGGGPALALATMIKIHPAVGLLWFIGRRDWHGVGLFALASAVLLALQAPWLDDFIRFYQTDAAVDTIPGMSLSQFGPLIWGAAILAAAVLALWGSRGRFGWLLAVIAQLVVLPRVYLVNLPLLMAAPLPAVGRAASATLSPPARSTTPE